MGLTAKAKDKSGISKYFVIPADVYMDVDGRATQEAKAKAGIQLLLILAP
jgi:hypothetical protein